MKLIIIFLFSILFLFANENKTVYTRAVVNNNYLDVYVINKNLFDITLELKSEHKNLLPLVYLPLTKSFKGNSKTKVAQFFIERKKFLFRSSYSWVLGNKNAKHDDSYLYRLPYELNTKQMVTQGFNGSFSHKGNSKYAIDFGLKEGTPVYASRSGIVVKTKNDSNKGGPSRKFIRLANYITIKHSDGTYAKYTHLKKNTSKVKTGDLVKRGEYIARSGNTGFSNGPHLHLVIFKAKDNKSRKSIAIKFISKNGIVLRPKKGKYYISTN